MIRAAATIILLLVLCALLAGHAKDIANECCMTPPLGENCGHMFGDDEPCFVSQWPSSTISSTESFCHQLLPYSEDLPTALSSSVTIVGTDLKYATACETSSKCTFHQNESENCPDKFGGWTQISLNISYTIEGNGFQGVMFNLTTDFEQEFESLNKSCHYVCLDRQLPPEKFRNKVFTYSGYRGLHPGATYTLTATALFTNNQAASSRTLHVENCLNQELSNREGVCNYHCNIWTPANDNLIRNVGLTEELHGWFSILPCEEDKITSYNFSLRRGMSDWWTESILIANTKENIRWNDEFGKILKHSFTGSGPGLYTARVFGQPDSVCLNDIHWQTNCTSTTVEVTVPRGLVESVHTTKDTSSNHGSTNPPPGPVVGKSRKIDDVSVQVMLLVIIVGSIVAASAVLLIQLLKRVKCTGLSDNYLGSDAFTRVGSLDDINRFSPRTLQTSNSLPT